MNDIMFATIAELETLLSKKNITPEELLSMTLSNFKHKDEKLGSALELFSEESIRTARSTSGSLYAIPGIIKDNICQKDRITSCASKMLEHFRSPYDATAIDRLKNAGAFLVGRANMDEFAMGSSTETSAFKKTVNPWNHACVPGGSSGGSIAAVAAGLVPWSLGSETGGSVRHPAALCGIVGFKPTYGLISRYGLIAYASSLDQIGIATRTVYDCARVLSVIAGHDEHDGTTIRTAPKDYTALLDGKIPQGLKIGIIDSALYAEGVDPEVVQAITESIKVFEKAGATLHHTTIPTMEYSAAVYFIISRAEAASNLGRFDGVKYGLRVQGDKNLKSMYGATRHDGFGKEVRARILVGNYVLSSGHSGEFYGNAKKVQRILHQDFVNAFKEVDFLIAPTAPGHAFQFGAFDDNKLQMDLQDYFTCPANIVGIPALSIPCGFSSKGLPFGFQIIGPHLSEERMFQLADVYQRATDWHTKRPVC
jgi:aspartyl-tRNA(Asn)/glutamyl-tRNA(Gln) amidotransferase subunit A